MGSLQEILKNIRELSHKMAEVAADCTLFCESAESLHAAFGDEQQQCEEIKVKELIDRMGKELNADGILVYTTITNIYRQG